MHYTIKSFDSNTGIIEFYLYSKYTYTHSIKLNPEYKGYLGVSDKHYMDPETNAIIVDESEIYNRVIKSPVIYLNNKKYTAASQSDYDRWSVTEFPEDDNSKIYKLLEKIVTENDDYFTSKEDEVFDSD
jgi:hypothetical protein